MGEDLNEDAMPPNPSFANMLEDKAILWLIRLYERTRRRPYFTCQAKFSLKVKTLTTFFSSY